MHVRSLIYKLMVASPAVFMLGVGMGARTLDDRHRFVACTPEQDRQIAAYGPIVAETEFVLGPMVRRTPEGLRALAAKWVAEADAGTLKPLTPISLRDNVQQGAKAQAFRACMLLCHRFIESTLHHREENTAEDAAKDLLLALRLAEVMKYSDFTSLAISTVYQRRALTALREMEGLSPGSAEKVAAELTKLRADERPLAVMASLMRRHEAEERVALGRDPMPVPNARRLFAANLAAIDAKEEPALDPGIFAQINALRTGCAAHASMQGALAATIAHLRGEPEAAAAATYPGSTRFRSSAPRR